jgi:Zn ribbon nucleic-acid-binding protein
LTNSRFCGIIKQEIIESEVTMLILDATVVCPNCGKERKRLNNEEDGVFVTCVQCGVPFEIKKEKKGFLNSEQKKIHSRTQKTNRSV